MHWAIMVEKSDWKVHYKTFLDQMASERPFQFLIALGSAELLNAAVEPKMCFEAFAVILTMRYSIRRF